MITLRELVDRQSYSKETDNELIMEWFIQNDKAVEGIEMISTISKRKIEQDKWKYGNLIGDLQMYGATESLIKNFGKQDGFKIDTICRNFIVTKGIGEDFAEKYPTAMKWLREIIPTKKLPKIFWRDFLDFLNNNGIYFIDQEKKEK